MIHGIGTDIVATARFEAMWARHGQRLAQRILSERELDECAEHSTPARFLAKRFAAKEALAKAIGSGLRHPVSLRRISIMHDGLGKPMFLFDDVLRGHMAQLGISAPHLSISDERDVVIAFVVLEC
jgi:holo-[acyl-carrier protein] synthase